ncbi:MAG: ATP-binding protein [archaeon]
MKEEENQGMEEEQPRPVTGERIKKSIVKEDIDIFDEVFEGKTEKHEEEEIFEENKVIEEEKETKNSETEEKQEKKTESSETEEKKPEKKNAGKAKKNTVKAEEKNDPEETTRETESDETEESAETKEKEKTGKKKRKTKNKSVYEKKELTQKEKNLLNESEKDELEEELPEKQEIKKKIIENAKIYSEEEFDEALDEEDIDGIEYYSGEEKHTLGGEKTIALEPEQTTSIKLAFLEDEQTGNAFIGRKKSVFEKYREKASLFMGKVSEENFPQKSVFLDSLNPHVVFVCGARGSGKSYVLGVLAEELSMKNKDVGIIVIDPIGVFWSMRFPNKEVNEVSRLSEWNLMPQGLDTLKVFIPEGIKSEVPKSTYDATFSIQPSLLTAEDWCLTFGMERFGPSGLLLSKVLKKLEHGFKAENKYIKAKKNYSLNEMVYCLEKDEELNSRERGYKQDSIRALVSRFEAAKSWGIFSDKGTPLGELSRENQLTVLDTSFLEDDVTALVIGIIARRLLSARKISTRKEAAKKFKKNIDEILELDVPPTWLFIDEAHTLIPSGNVKTPATSALVEYVKQGRRPGCSLVFATQQPSAIDTRVLSQLDILVSHKLVFDDDIKAIFKRIPSIVPLRYKKSSFIRTLSVGTALVADRREETSRAFIMNIRPRMSQHEGRDAETSESKESVSEEQVTKLAEEMIWKKLEQEPIEMNKVNVLVDSLNGKYKSKVMLSSVLDALEERGAVIEAERVFIKGIEGTKKPEEEIETEEEKYEKEVELGLKEQEIKAKQAVEEPQKAVGKELTIALKIDEESARKIAGKNRKKKSFGVFGSEERIKGIMLNYEAVYKISLNDFDLKREFVSVDCYVNAITGELLHFNGKEFIESKGFSKTGSLNKSESVVLKNLLQKKTLKEISEKNHDIPEEKARKIISVLAEKGFIKKEKKEGKMQYSLDTEIDLPFTLRHKIVSSVNNCSFSENLISNSIKEKFSSEEVNEMIKGFWPNSVVKKTSRVFRPVYYVSLEENGKERTLKIDAMTGQVI